MCERHIPTPGVDASDPNATRCQIERRLASHATAGGEILLGADATAGARIDQNNIKRLQLMPDACELCLHLGRFDDMAIGHAAEVELHAGSEEPVKRHLVDAHHSF